MILPTLPIAQPSFDVPLKNIKFTRRDDLSNAIRLSIASSSIHAQMTGSWGTITELANKYNISRTFVYMLGSTLKESAHFLFGISEPLLDLSIRELSIQAMLSFRLEGRSSIGAISTILKRFKLELSSTGSISQLLSRIGAVLPNTLSTKETSLQYLVFLSDEIFSKNIPILVTVDPSSSAILKIELSETRKGKDWQKHFECLQNNGFQAIYLVSDEGQGLCAGHAEALSDVVRQSDTYHAIAHQLGSWVDRLEKAAYKAIEEEHACETKFDSAKSEPVQQKRLMAYELASKAAEDAVALFDDFSYLYFCIIEQLNVFDMNGNLRSREQAEACLMSGLMLINELNHKKISKAIKKVHHLLPNLFHYFDRAKTVVEACKELPISEECLKAYCVAWQWGKIIRKSKKSSRRNWAKEQEQFCLDIAENQHELSAIKQQVYSELDKIVQSSALVECINSIIRPYLNTSKNHVTQEMLNLIMYYHNHRRYQDGLRKNKTPMELLTGTKQTEDWISLIFSQIRLKDPDILLVA